jgi:Domain of unknown function (DUF2017)
MVRLPPNVRTIVAQLALQLVPAVESRDPMTRRLFPPAYASEDRTAEEEGYRRLVDVALTNHHRSSLEVLASTADAEILDQEELEAWLSGLESLRLVLGTRLDVTEETKAPEPGDVRFDEHSLYDLLGHVQSLVIDVLAADLPDEGRPEGAW